MTDIEKATDKIIRKIDQMPTKRQWTLAMILPIVALFGSFSLAMWFIE